MRSEGGMHAEPTGDDASSDAYTLDVSEHEGTRVLSATGEIDIISAPALRAALLPALEAAESVVLDMSGVNFLGSSGLAVLVEARDQAQRSSGELRLVCSSRIVLRALEATGLRELFEISPDLATALQR
ncbi:STAS domain-containing protein [Pseudonocardia spinosispora]|uniref:STAS domain-containing protein n=1 Tax=Pseudonocardia spinosispora TaxID=103441 RepID=UPI00041E50F7|nr:STAS domain-containing protein [Pseudonocardia spinosispora]